MNKHFKLKLSTDLERRDLFLNEKFLCDISAGQSLFVTRQFGHDAVHTCKTPSQLMAKVEAANKAGQPPMHYTINAVNPNKTYKPGTGGSPSNTDVIGFRGIWLDFDASKGQTLPADWFPTEPSYVIESSPGSYHVYFLFNALETDLKRCQDFILYCIWKYKCDALKDYARVTKVPGTLRNDKGYDGTFAVGVVSNVEGAHTLDTLIYGEQEYETYITQVELERAHEAELMATRLEMAKSRPTMTNVSFAKWQVGYEKYVGNVLAKIVRDTEEGTAKSTRTDTILGMIATGITQILHMNVIDDAQDGLDRDSLFEYAQGVVLQAMEDTGLSGHLGMYSQSSATEEARQMQNGVRLGARATISAHELALIEEWTFIPDTVTGDSEYDEATLLKIIKSKAEDGLDGKPDWAACENRARAVLQLGKLRGISWHKKEQKPWNFSTESLISRENFNMAMCDSYYETFVPVMTGMYVVERKSPFSVFSTTLKEEINLRGSEWHPLQADCPKDVYNTFEVDHRVAHYMNAGYIYNEKYIDDFKKALTDRVDLDDAEWLLRGFAQTVQNPKDRKVSPFFHGINGTGKGGIIDLMIALAGYGKNENKENDNRTPWVHKSFVYKIDEVSEGDRSAVSKTLRDKLETLKTYISESSVKFSEKGLKGRDVTPYYWVMLSTNYYKSIPWSVVSERMRPIEVRKCQDKEALDRLINNPEALFSLRTYFLTCEYEPLPKREMSDKFVAAAQVESDILAAEVADLARTMAKYMQPVYGYTLKEIRMLLRDNGFTQAGTQLAIALLRNDTSYGVTYRKNADKSFTYWKSTEQNDRA